MTIDFVAMSFKGEIVVDCRGHLLGRLASVVAKELVNGQRVVCVRTEDINISGALLLLGKSRILLGNSI